MNIMFIQVDQMAANCLSFLGNENVKTPNWDRLIRGGGAFFSDATCQSPICLPSRISMFSGQYVSTTKQFGFTGFCDRRMPWLPEHLQSLGYATGAFGKFHAMSVGMDRWGFDVSAPTIPEDYDLARPVGNHYGEYCRRNGIAFPTDQMHAHDCFAETFEPRHPASSPADKPNYFRQCCRSDVPIEHSLETYTTERALEFLDERSRDIRPFFMWVTYDRPHFPSTLPPEWFDKISPETIRLADLPSAESLTTLPRSYFKHFPEGASIFNWGEEDFRFVLSTYYTLIERLDSEVGRLIEALEASSAAGNTIIVFTSDHGDEAGFNGQYNKFRRNSSEAVTKVPLIIVPPKNMIDGKDVSRVYDSPVELVDLVPTLLSMCDLPPMRDMEGRDLSHAILNDAPLPMDRPVFCEDYHVRMIRKNGWKLLFDRKDNGQCMLFNMTDDPNQFVNRYSEKTCQTVRMELKRELLSFLCQRSFGGYTDYDVETVENGLDPKSTTIPAHTTLSAPNTLHACRCAAFIENKSHKLYVAFHKPEFLLFKLTGDQVRDMYSRRDRAMEMDWDVAEDLLDTGLRYMMNSQPTVSILHPRNSSGPSVELHEARALALH